MQATSLPAASTPPTEAAPTPIRVPTARDIESSRLTAFIRYCEQRCAVRFASYAAFESFGIRQPAVFWTALLEWSGLLHEGDPAPAFTSGECERATFFPSLRLNYAENLLRLDGADLAPDRPAVTGVRFDGTIERWTRAQLRARVAALSAALQALGAGPADRVALIAHNTPDAVAAALAAASLGCTVSTLAPELGTLALVSRLQRIEPAVVFTDLAAATGAPGAQLRGRVAEALKDVYALRALIVLDGADAPPGIAVPVLRASELLRERAGQSAPWPRLPFNHPLFVLFSSGTTGPPKCIVHGAGGTLLEHVKEHRLHCDLRADDRLFFQTSTGWMMWNWQLSALAGGTEIVLYDGAVVSPDALWRIVAGQRVSAFGTSPGYLQLCERSAAPVVAGLDFSALRAIFSTGSILSPRQQDWVSEHVKRLPLQSISGGTDIIGCFVLGNPNLPAYSAQSACRSLGLDVQALGPDGAPTRGIGELVCANPFPSRPIGFLHDPEGRLFHDAYFRQNPGYWTHGDLVEFTPEGGVRLHGRSDGVLNVRGIRIGPAEIYRILERMPEISDAMAIEQASAQDIGGSRLVLLVVLKEGGQLDDRLRAEIRRQLAQQGSPAHVPSVILAVADLPTTYSGKRSERSARDALNGLEAGNAEALRNPRSLDVLRAFARESQQQPTAEAAPPPAVPGTPLTVAQMRQVWERQLGLGSLREDDSFFDLGGDSLAALGLMAEVGRRTGRELPLTALVNAPTIVAFTAAVNAAQPASSSLLVRLNEGGTALPLFIVHGYGGLVMELRPLAQQMATPSPVYGIRASGFEAGETVYERVEDMCRAYLDAMREVQPHGPYLIAGYSLGGQVAHEMARQLHAAGEHVALLVLLDTTTHERYWPPAAWMEYLARRAAHHLRRLRGQRGMRTVTELTSSARALFDRVRGAAAAAPPPDELGGVALPESVRRLRQAGLAAFAQHRPAWGPLPITLLRSDLRESSLCDPRLVWGRLTPRLEVRDVPGDHRSIIRPPNLEVLARQLSECVDEALRRIEESARQTG